MSKRAVLKENSDSYDHLHLWYSTSEVIHALELFIMGGEELSGSSTYRLAFWSFKTCAEYTSSSCDYHKLGTLLVYSGVRNSFYLIWCSLDSLLHPQLRLGWPDKTSFSKICRWAILEDHRMLPVKWSMAMELLARARNFWILLKTWTCSWHAMKGFL